MAPSNNRYQIVRTWSGPNTGESYYLDDCGQVWITTHGYIQTNTGEEKAELIGNEIVSNQ